MSRLYKIITGPFDDYEPLLPDLSVDGPKSVDTGLIDSRGHKIYNIQPPIGFGRDSEWV